jgi:serine protease AprX
MRVRVTSVLSVMLVACSVGLVAQLLPPPPPLTPPPFIPPPPVPDLHKLDPLLQTALMDTWAQSRVIVRAADSASLPQVTALIAQVGGTAGRLLPIIDARAATVPNVALPLLAASNVVTRIASDRVTLGTNERTGAAVGATAVRQTLGYDGAGIGIAVIDSGVAPSHADLTDSSGSMQRVVQFVDFVGSGAEPYDDFGHGTHVAGIIAGNGFDSGGLRTGIAPAASLVVLKVLDASGHGSMSDLIGAFDYVLANQAQYSIRAVNLSIGAGVYESYDTDLLTLAAKRLAQAGIVVVAAAGNNGSADGAAQYGGVIAPGNAPWVLTVGASTHNGTVDRGDDAMATFSSRGPTAVDYAAKPDLVAPGVGTESLNSPGSTLSSTRASALLAGTVDPGYLPYLSLSGTSQATPVVTGTVALMLQANPSLTPNAVKAILQYTAQLYPGYDPLTQGAGFLNALGAVQLARAFAGVPLPPDGDGPAWGRQIIWGNHLLSGGVPTFDASAWSVDVDWGAPSHAPGNVAWGVIFDSQTSTWSAWGASCSDATCSDVTWGSPGAANVVWGSTCGGADCPASTTWPGGPMMQWSSGNPHSMWGTADGEGDTIVWGTSCDPDCQ